MTTRKMRQRSKKLDKPGVFITLDVNSALEKKNSSKAVSWCPDSPYISHFL
jgi:hypothetical protein